MRSPNQLSLLRRTLAAIAAATFAFAAADALAQGKVKLTGGNKADECSYSSMSITPDGSVIVQCSGSPPPPPPPVDNTSPGTMSFENASLTAAPNAKATLKVLRSGGTKGSFKIAISPYGASCWGNPSAVNIADGATSVTFEIQMGNVVDSWCEITLLSVSPTADVSGASLGSTKTARVTVTSSGGPGPGVPGCAPTPQGMLASTFVGLGNPLLQMQASGQIVAIPLPIMSSSGQVTFGESAGGAYTPQPVTLEVSINKCPGLIDTDYANRCNIRSTNGNYNSITWLAKAYQGRGGSGIDASTASANGLCWAGGADKYYINARWSYSSCAFGAQVCGFAIQYNLGGY